MGLAVTTAELRNGSHFGCRAIVSPSQPSSFRPLPTRFGGSKEKCHLFRSTDGGCYARPMSKHPHILNAASNLLGIALIIVTGLHVARRSQQSMADEIALLAAFLLGLSCLLSYVAIRAEPNVARFESWADRAFLGGLLAILAAVALFAVIEG